MISRAANIHPTVKLGHHIFIEDNAEIGLNTVIKNNVEIREGVIIGRNCIIGSHCIIEKGCTIDDNIIIKDFSLVVGNVKAGSSSWIKNPYYKEKK